MPNVCQICGNEENLCCVSDYNIGYICMSCITDYLICEQCHTLTPKENTTRVDVDDNYSQWYCKECASHLAQKTCSICGEPTYSKATTDDNKPICYNCISQHNYTLCSHCGHYSTDILASSSLFYKQYPNQLQQDTAYCTHCVNELTKNIEPLPLGDCKICGLPTTDTKVLNDTIYYVCADHADLLVLCQGCNRPTNYNTIEETTDGLRCPTCLNKYSFCETCGTYVQDKHIKQNPITGEPICKKCLDTLQMCDCCSKFVDDVMYDDRVGMYLCESCSNLVKTCQSCGKYYILFDRYSLCDDCKSRRRYIDINVNYYSWVPTLHYNRLPGETTKLYYGFENEMQNLDEDVDTAEAFGHIPVYFKQTELYVKSDSSIDNGYEVVSHPFTFKAFQRRDWSKLFTGDIGYDESCGMHVHMSRNAFSRLQLFKVVRFIYDYPDFIEFIGGRSFNQYCEPIDKHDVVNKGKNVKKKTGNKYHLVNTSKKNTIEFRFFANVEEECDLRKNIEFLDALYHFTKFKGLKSTERLDKFIEYVSEMSHTYPNLNRHMMDWS